MKKRDSKMKECIGNERLEIVQKWRNVLEIVSKIKECIKTSSKMKKRDSKMKACIGNCFKMNECIGNSSKIKECIGNCS